MYFFYVYFVLPGARSSLYHFIVAKDGRSSSVAQPVLLSQMFSRDYSSASRECHRDLSKLGISLLVNNSTLL